jgi:hypothetical protein
VASVAFGLKEETLARIPVDENPSTMERLMELVHAIENRDLGTLPTATTAPVFLPIETPNLNIPPPNMRDAGRYPSSGGYAAGAPGYTVNTPGSSSRWNAGQRLTSQAQVYSQQFEGGGATPLRTPASREGYGRSSHPYERPRHNREICQICHKAGHTADKCYQRTNQKN